MYDFYRIHSAAEPLETLLDPRRPDGWVASDEDRETQPYGVSACISLDDLYCYVEQWGLAIQPGDRLVRLVGRLSHEPDRDQGAVRVIVERYEVIGDAQAWLDAWREDPADIRDEIEELGEEEALAHLTPAAREWIVRRLAE